MNIDKEESHEDFSKERNKAKNQRHNYTIKEKRVIFTKYKENKSVTDTAKLFNILEQHYQDGFKSKNHIFLKKIIYQIYILNLLERFI